MGDSANSTSVSSSTSSFVIAVCGGGIAGLAAAVTLQRLPNVEIHVFEQATAFREVGASIALGPNGMRGLEEIGALSALSEDIAFKSSHGYPMLYRHWKTFEILTKDTYGSGVTNPLHHTARFYRPHLLAALVENTNPEIVTLHLRKRLQKYDVREEDVLLRFEDGEEFKADLVVGSDGIKSVIRQTYDPSFELTFTGQINLRGTFPISLLDDLRPEFPDIGDSIHLPGPDNHFFSSAMGLGLFTVVGMAYVDPEERDPAKLVWNEEASLDEFRSYYKDWHPFIRAIADRTPNIQAYESWASDSAPHPISSGRICLIGDSYHPLGGAFASGGSLAIDDARALYYSLSHHNATDKRDRKERIARALDLYLETRKPHIDRVMEFVRDSRRASAKRPGESRRWSEEKIRTWAKEKKSVRWLHEHDVHLAFREALERLEGEGGGTKKKSLFAQKVKEES